MSYNIDVNSEDSVLIHMDSRDATAYLQTGHTSYFQYQLRDKIQCPKNQAMLVSLHSATVPYSFYNIRAGVNDIVPIEIYIYAGVKFTHTITLTPSNYTVSSLAVHLTTLINALNYPFTMTMIYDTPSGKYKYAVAGTIDYLVFKFTSGAAEAGVECGFGPGDHYVYSQTPLVSQNVVDVHGSVHGVYLRTNLTSRSVLDSQNGSLSNILARMAIPVQPGGIIFFHPRDSIHHSMVRAPDIQTMTIRLTDERNRLLDLNGLHFQLSIKVDFVYDKAVVPEATRQEERGADPPFVANPPAASARVKMSPIRGKPGVIQRVRNKASRLAGCPEESQLFPGENHMQAGKCSASFAGPGTHWLRRANRGDRGRGPIDSICAYNHDLDYTKTGLALKDNKITKEQGAQQVRAADIEFIQCVEKHKRGSKVNSTIATAAFKAKMAAEDRGVSPGFHNADKTTVADAKELGEKRVKTLLSKRR